MGLYLGGNGIIDPFCYVDASYVSDSDCKSQLAYVVYLGDFSGACISKSFKDKTVSLSSTDPEMKGLFSLTKFLEWWKLLLTDLGIVLPKPILIYEDNQPTINIVSTRANHASTNYMNVKINYIRQQIQSHQITVQYCPTSEMVADMLTKALPKAQFEYLRRKLLGSAPSRPTEK
jgi:hypothetical protein